MADLEESISDYIQEQFEVFQLDEKGLSGPGATSSRATSIKKHVQLAILNHGIASLTVDDMASSESPSIDEPDQITTIVTPILIRYVDAALTMETNAETKDVVARVLDLVSALACAVSSDAVQTIVERAHLFSEVLSERQRSLACDLLGYLACHLRLALVQMKPRRRPHDSNKNHDTTWAVRLLEMVEVAIVPRLSDKSQMVRNSAIRAVAGLLSVTKEDLGSPSNSDNDVKSESDSTKFTKALDGLLWTLWHDPSAANRVEALQAVPVSTSKDLLDHVISRIRDVKERVRVTALDVLRLKVDPRHMKEEQFCEIIQHGLTGRCEATKTAATKLICTKWLKAAKFDPVALLRWIRPSTNDVECEKALKIIFATARSVDHHAIQDLSDPEIQSFCVNIDEAMVHLNDVNVLFDECELFFTRVACSTAQDSNDLTFGQKEDLLAKITPDIPTLCDLFQKHLIRLIESIHEGDQESEDEEGFVCSELLKLAQVAGLREEGSRRHFANVMNEVLSNTELPDDLVEDCLQALRAAYDNDIDYFDSISTVVFNISSPDEDSEGLSVGHGPVQTQRDLRVLLIFTVVLENAPSSLSSHELLDSMGKVILYSLVSSDRLVREVGISCVGRLGLFSRESTVLTEFKPVLLQVAANDDEAVQCRGQALMSLADWALLYPEIIQPILEVDDLGTHLSLITIIQDLMTHPNQLLQAISAEVATKLFFSGRLCDSHLVARLVVMFFDPKAEDTSDDEENDVKQVGSPVRLQQLLSLFFPAFSRQSTETRYTFLKSIGKALEFGLNPCSSNSKKRTATFPFVKMVEYVCSVTVESEIAFKAALVVEDPDLHDATKDINVELIASLQVAEFLIKNESMLTSTQIRSLCKLLGGFEIDAGGKDKTELGKLKDYLDELESVLSESPLALRSLENLIEAFAGVKGAEDDDGQGSSIADEESLNDDETVSEESFGAAINLNLSIEDESTVADSIMDSLAKLSVNKENVSRIAVASAKTSTKRSIESSVSVLESLGSPNM